MMAIQKLGTNIQQTRDELSSEPDTQPIYKIKSESLIVEVSATKVTTETIGHSWIVGSSMNGIVGTNTDTEDGEQQVVGGAGRVVTLRRVTNPNNTFNERFRYDTFIDDEKTTATLDTTNGRIDF